MSARRARRVLGLALLAPLLSAGCYASNVLAEADRDVRVTAKKRVWRPATAEDLSGFFASTEVEGESAGAVLKAYYYFGHGAYSGAALVVGSEGPRFVVIAEEGRYTFEGGKLDLKDGSGALTVQAAKDGFLRLDSGGSTITFQRAELR